MAILRVIGYLLVYGALASIVYAFMIDVVNKPAICFASIALAAVGGLLLFLTRSYQKPPHQRRSNAYWDGWDVLDLFDIPFRLIVWIIGGMIKAMTKIFD